MEITKVKGIIISENAYSETSKLLNIFTEEYGIISVIAKGAKSIKSPIRSVTTKLTYAIFQIYYKKGKLSTLVCADVINPFTEIISTSRAPVLSIHLSLAPIGSDLETLDVIAFILSILLL